MKPTESKRVDLDRKVVLRFPDFDGFVTEYAANLSMTGMFVRSQEPQRAGTPVSFELRLEDGASLVRGNGWVVWSRGPDEVSNGPAGMGIEFTELDPKSRKLVRWMILHQLPEGEDPFDVRSGNTGNTALPAGFPSGAWSASRSRSKGIAIGAAVFLALAALVYWGGIRSPGREPDLAPIDQPEAALERAVGARAEATDFAATVGPSPPGSGGGQAAEGESATPVAQRAEPSGQAQDVADIEEFVRNWARAWSDGDVENYLSCYAGDFVPEEKLARAEWDEIRRRRLTAPRTIRVDVTRLEARVLAGDEARVSFLQTYRADDYADTVDKVLTLGRTEGGWKIRREVAD